MTQGNPIIRIRMTPEWIMRLRRVMTEDGYDNVSEYLRGIIKKQVMKREREARQETDPPID